MVKEDNLLIPKGIHAQYVSRVLPGGLSDLEGLELARKDRTNTLIEGDTGLGKTKLVMAHAEVSNLPFYSVNCNRGTNPDEMFGGWTPTAEGNFCWTDGVVTQLVRTGGVLLLDEINFMKSDIAAALHPLLDDRRTLTLLLKGGEVIKAHNDFQVVACMNPDYEGTNPLNWAFKNRFTQHWVFTYEDNNEDILIENRPHLLQMGGLLRDAKDNGTISSPVSTNSLMSFADMTEDTNLDYAVWNFINRFDEDERPAVSEIIQVMLPQLCEDFGIDSGDYVDNTTEVDTDEDENEDE